MSRGERILMLVFLVLAAGGTVLALEFERYEARLFPLVAGSITMGIILVYFAAVSVPALRRPLRPYLEDETFQAGSGQQEEDPERPSAQKPAQLDDRTRHRRELSIFGLLAGFGLLCWLVGVTIAGPVFLFGAMLFYSRESLRLTLLITGAATVFLYVIFVIVLRLPPHLGLLGQLL